MTDWLDRARKEVPKERKAQDILQKMTDILSSEGIHESEMDHGVQADVALNYRSVEEYHRHLLHLIRTEVKRIARAEIKGAK